MRLLALVSLLVALAAWTAPAAAQPAGDPVPKILEAWKKRQTAFKSVKYVITGKVEHAFLSPLRKGMENIIKLPKTPFSIPYKSIVILDCENQRYRVTKELRTWSPSAQAFLPSSTTVVYDGGQVYVSFASEDEFLKKGTSDLTIVRGNLATYQIGAEIWPVFAAHGIVATAQRPLRPDRLPLLHPANEFVHRSESARGGVKCELLYTDPLDVVPAASDEISVDLKADGFIRRHVYYAGRNPFARLDVKPQVKRGFTYPAEWTCTWSEGKRTKTVHRLRVESFEGSEGGPETEFRPTLRAGMTVEEHKLPAPGSGLDPSKHHVKKYTVGPGGGLNVTGEAPQYRLDGTEVPSGFSGRWFWTVGIGLVVVFSCFVIQRRRRKST